MRWFCLWARLNLSYAIARCSFFVLVAVCPRCPSCDEKMNYPDRWVPWSAPLGRCETPLPGRLPAVRLELDRGK